MIFDLESNARKPEQVSHVWCICCLDPDTGQQWQFTGSQAPQALGILSQAPKLIGHNVAGYDLPVLERLYGFKYLGEVVDTLILSRLLFNGLSDEPDRHGRHALEAWGKRLGYQKGEWSDFSRWDPAMTEYCIQDCLVVQRLLEHFRELDPSPAACRLELAYDTFLRRTSKHGFTLDVESTGQLKRKLERRTERLQRHLDHFFPPEEVTNGRPSWYSLEIKEPELFKTPEIPQFPTKLAMETWRKQQKLKPRDVQIITGPPSTKTIRFNANSPKQAVSGLRSIGWDPYKVNESGSISTSELQLWTSGLAAGRLIAAYRGYSKLLSFCNQWLKHQQDGKLYPSFLSNYAATGRSSCRSPNIQQIPSDKQRKSGMRLLVPYGKRCRALFKPQDGYRLVGADLSGIEVRLLAHRLAPYDEGSFAELVVSGADIHQRNAEAIGIERDHAKTVLYGSLYGQGATSLAAALGISLDEAKDIIQGFTHGLDGFAAMKRELLQELRETGRIELIDKRRIQCNSTHKALNYAIQGEAAILMKHWAMQSVKSLDDTSYRLLAVVHDELQGECLPMDVTAAMGVLEETAVDVGQQLGFRVAIAANASHGSNWSQTH